MRKAPAAYAALRRQRSSPGRVSLLAGRALRPTDHISIRQCRMKSHFLEGTVLCTEIYFKLMYNYVVRLF